MRAVKACDSVHEATTCSSTPLSDTTPTPLLPPPPGPQPARQTTAGDEPAAVSTDLALDLMLHTVPRLARARDELGKAPLAHRDWYILALIDGQTSVQALVDIAGMEPDDVLRILQRLRRLALITLT
jgi:hypothetical protein